MTATMPELTPDAVRDTVKDALRNRRLWDELTATENGRAVVLDELTRLRDDVGMQMSARSDSQGALKAEYDAGLITHREYAKETAEFHRWHGSASRFRSVVMDRISQLRPFVATTHRRLSDEANGYKETVIALSKAIYLHQSEELDDAGLYAVLEDLTVPAGLDGRMTLFDLATRILKEHS